MSKPISPNTKYNTEERRRLHCMRQRRLTARKKAGLPPLVGRHVNVLLDVWNHVDQREAAECWPWTGSANQAGYGQFSSSGHNFTATNVVYQLTFPLTYDPNLFVLHRCDNPPCCNPLHLWQGTKTDNGRDASKKGRSRPNGQLSYISIHQIIEHNNQQYELGEWAERLNMQIKTLRQRLYRWGICPKTFETPVTDTRFKRKEIN